MRELYPIHEWSERHGEILADFAARTGATTATATLYATRTVDGHVELFPSATAPEFIELCTD